MQRTENREQRPVVEVISKDVDLDRDFSVVDPLKALTHSSFDFPISSNVFPCGRQVATARSMAKQVDFFDGEQHVRALRT